jgi:hypothetical protein
MLGSHNEFKGYDSQDTGIASLNTIHCVILIMELLVMCLDILQPNYQDDDQILH